MTDPTTALREVLALSNKERDAEENREYGAANDLYAELQGAAVNLISTHGPALLSALEDARQEGRKEAQQPAAVDGAAVRWAVDRWNDEVANRPLVNVHRRTLDVTWRQMIRHFGGDDVTLCGPRHDDLVAQQGVRHD